MQMTMDIVHAIEAAKKTERARILVSNGSDNLRKIMYDFGHLLNEEEYKTLFAAMQIMENIDTDVWLKKDLELR
jgi:hypothetical protein